MARPISASHSVVYARPPFDFRIALAYLSRSPLEPLEVVLDGLYRRALVLNDRPFVMDVNAHGSLHQPTLEIRLHGDQVDSESLEAAERFVARTFRLDEDHAPLERVARLDPVFGGLLARMRGARALLMTSPFEALIWAILGQQINIAFAYKLKRALVETYGETIECGERKYFLFPAAQCLASAAFDELRAIQFSRQKADYVRNLSELEAAGEIDWECLREAPTDEAIAELTRLRGVGRWTAEYVCMRGLGHRDVIPAADMGLRAVIGRAYGIGRTATEAEVRELAERWAGWRSHAAFCWWHTLSRNA